MYMNGKVRPDCNYASNPYHECTDSCLRRIAEGKGRRDKKKTENGVSFNKRYEEKRGQRSCLKASNPYHECNDNCFRSGAAPGSGQAVKPGGKKMKESQSMPARDLENAPERTQAYNSSVSMPPARLTSPEKIESQNGERFSSSETGSGEIELEDPSGTLPMSDKSRPSEPATHQKGASGSPSGSTSFTFSGVAEASDDDDEAQSVTSEGSVSVGKYRVKRRLSPILESILAKHGDIAASCHLESIAMRSYYLQSVCFVVQELQITQPASLTKSKAKEMMAILKDVEASGINVAWLRCVLGENSEAIELVNQHQAIEEAKASCDRDIESAKRKLEAQMESLSLKEKEVGEVKKAIAETRGLLKELELKSSVLSESVRSIKAKMERLNGKKSLLDGVL